MTSGADKLVRQESGYLYFYSVTDLDLSMATSLFQKYSLHITAFSFKEQAFKWKCFRQRLKRGDAAMANSRKVFSEHYSMETFSRNNSNSNCEHEYE